MPVIGVTGRNARAFWTLINTQQLISQGSGNNFLLAKNDNIPDAITKHPVTGSQGWASFPFLNSVSITVEGGTQLITVLGLENPVSIEEVGLPLQDVSVEMLFQPTQEGKKLFNLFRRVTDTNDPFEGHYPLGAIRLFITGMTYYEGGSLQKGLVHRVDCWSCIPRSISFNQPEGGPATVRLSLGTPFVKIKSESGVTVPPPGYNVGTAILNAFEGRVVLYDENGQNALDTDVPLLLTSLSFDIRNNVQALHTFLKDVFTDVKFMNAVRAPRVLAYGVQTVEGSFTLFAPRDIAANININRIPKYGKVEIMYYPFAGSDSNINSIPTTPQITFTLHNIKFTRTAYNVTPDRALSLSLAFQATTTTDYAWDVS